jgi:serine/threonine-protein kinase RsbW
MKHEQRTLKLKSIPESFNLVEKLIEEVCDEYNLNHNYLGCIITSVNEAFQNALIHGNKCQDEKNISITFKKVPTGISFTISDEGNGFDHKSIPDVNEKNIGTVYPGRGLFLIKSLSDDVVFNEMGNEISLEFKISSINIETEIDRIEKFQVYAKPTQKTLK